MNELSLARGESLSVSTPDGTVMVICLHADLGTQVTMYRGGDDSSPLGFITVERKEG